MAARKTKAKKPQFSWEQGYEPVKEYTLSEARAYLKSKGKTSGRFYYNVFGGSTYYTLEPTTATPTGKLKGFPRTQIITAQGMGAAPKNPLAKALRPEKYKILLEHPNGAEEVAIFNRQGDAYIAAKALMKAAPSSHRYYIVPIKRKSL